MSAQPKPIHPVGATDHPDALPAASNPVHEMMRDAILDGLEKQGHVLVKKDRDGATSTAPPPPAPLTATERSAFLGLQAQAREYERVVNEQERAIVAEIEARLGLDAGSIGVSHTVNPQTWTVAVLPILPKGHPRPPQPDAQGVTGV